MNSDVSPADNLPPEEDPLLTAYALGALAPGQRAQVEARLAHDAQARAFVEQTRLFSGVLSEEMAAETEDEDAGLSPAQRRALRKLIAKRAPSRMKFPRIGILCAAVAILLALFMVMLWWSMAKK